MTSKIERPLNEEEFVKDFLGEYRHDFNFESILKSVKRNPCKDTAEIIYFLYQDNTDLSCKLKGIKGVVNHVSGRRPFRPLRASDGDADAYRKAYNKGYDDALKEVQSNLDKYKVT